VRVYWKGSGCVGCSAFPRQQLNNPETVIPPLKPYEWDVAVEPYKSFPLPNTVGYVANFAGGASEWQKHTFRSRI